MLVLAGQLRDTSWCDISIEGRFDEKVERKEVDEMARNEKGDGVNEWQRLHRVGRF